MTLKLANQQFMIAIKEPRNCFPEMDNMPLKKIDRDFGIPQEFFDDYEKAKEKIANLVQQQNSAY